MADTLVERITGQTTRRRGPDHRQRGDLRPGPPRRRPASPPGSRATARSPPTPSTRDVVDRASAASTPHPPTGALVAHGVRRPRVPHRPRPVHRPPRPAPAAPPYCDAPIRHRDHAERPRHTADPPPPANGQGLCEHCNHTKQAPGWTRQTRQRTTRPAPPDRHRATDRTTGSDPPHPPCRHPSDPAPDQPRRDLPQPDRARVRRLTPTPSEQPCRPTDLEPHSVAAVAG